MPSFYSEESRLEPEYADLYGAWKTKTTPATTNALLQGLQPAMESTIRTHIGDVNPLSISRARQMTVKALPQYDPASASMRTFLFSQLQGLKRWNSRQGQAVSIPERMALQRQAVARYEKEMEHELGRAPTDQEIADQYAIPLRRLAKIRANAPAVAESTLTRDTGQIFGGLRTPGATADPWQDYVYDQLSPTDQLIMQWTLGYNGHRKRSNQEIAAKLRLTPGAISQRKARIQAMLDERELLEGL